MRTITNEFEGGFIGRVDQTLRENRELKIKNLELIKQIREQREEAHG